MATRTPEPFASCPSKLGQGSKSPPSCHSNILIFYVCHGFKMLGETVLSDSSYVIPLKSPVPSFPSSFLINDILPFTLITTESIERKLKIFYPHIYQATFSPTSRSDFPSSSQKVILSLVPRVPSLSTIQGTLE